MFYLANSLLSISNISEMHPKGTTPTPPPKKKKKNEKKSPRVSGAYLDIRVQMIANFNFLLI